MFSHGLSKLLDQLKTSFIRTLVLINVSFSEESIRKLCLLIDNNNFLKNLDLSWNELRCSMYKPLLECLANNTILQEINLSHNQLCNFKRIDEIEC